MQDVPADRVDAVNDRPIRPEREFVLYWMIAQRRTHANFALQRAAAWCRRLGKPLVVLEALRCDHRWASDRLHAFVLAGMRDNAAAFAAGGATWHAFVEPERGAGKGLLEALAARAAVVVTDEFPCFFLPAMVHAAGRRLDVLLEQVDGNGLLPLRVADRVFARAFDFRRLLQRALPAHLREMPQDDPLRGGLPAPVPVPDAIARRWPAASAELLAASPGALAALPIDHTVPPVPGVAGGQVAARAVLDAFVRERLPRYATERGHPDAEAASGLSPYLHFGHLSVHQVFASLAAREGFRVERMKQVGHGKRGFYGMSDAAEAFLDELVTWRELGFVFAFHRPDHDRFESLPDWARATLHEHAGDPREHVYTFAQLDAAATHDPVWNAAQRQLRREGRIDNYLRMLWGKQVLAWSATPEAAWATLVELNNRYALDGRDPNSYTGIGWVFGRYDRPWAPRRPVLGTVRCMTSRSTLRKLRMKRYLARFAE